VLILGATGFIGRPVVEQLGRRGHDVLALLRPGSPAAGLPAGVEVRRGDLADPSSLRAQLTPDVDAVVNLATPTGSLEVDLAATDALLEPLRGTGRAYVYASGVWVLGPTDGRVADETSATDPLDIVGYRPRVERQVLAAAADGVRSVVLRPGIVHGRGGGIPAMLVGLAAEHGAGLHVGPAPVRWPMVHVDDLAELFALAAERAAPGTILHGVTEPGVDTGALARAAAAAAGVRGVRPWPLADARRALGEAFADALAADQTVSATVTRGSLAWQPTGPAALDDVAAGSYGLADVA
jgi:nucleoside-diphosphate-sugar epimerase